MYNTLMADEQPQPGEVIIPIDRDTPPAVSSAAPVETPSFSPPAQEEQQYAPPQADSTPAAPPAPTIEVQPMQAPPQVPTETPYAPAPTEGISWRSTEFTSIEKNRLWYGAVVLGSVLISVVIYFLNKDVITAAIVLIALVGLAYFSGRKPREQDFTVDREGVSVGKNYYPFHEFRNFSISEDATSTSFILIPLKRFMPAINIYVPAEYEQTVMTIVSEALPFDQHHVDVVDAFMRRIRF